MSATKTIQIFADTLGRARCRGCQAPIEWGEIVASGKKMPFDPPIAVFSEHVDPASRRRVQVVDLATNHWATCPKRDQFRQHPR